MVVYAVWDRVARVRFPAPRQTNKKRPMGVFCLFVGESKQIVLLATGIESFI